MKKLTRTGTKAIAKKGDDRPEIYYRLSPWSPHTRKGSQGYRYGSRRGENRTKNKAKATQGYLIAEHKKNHNRK